MGARWGGEAERGGRRKLGLDCEVRQEKKKGGRKTGWKHGGKNL